MGDDSKREREEKKKKKKERIRVYCKDWVMRENTIEGREG